MNAPSGHETPWLKCMGHVMKAGWLKPKQYWRKIEVNSAQFRVFCLYFFSAHRSGVHNEKAPDEIRQPLRRLLPLFNGVAW